MTRSIEDLGDFRLNLTKASLDVLHFAAARLCPSEDLFYLHDLPHGNDFHWRPEETCPEGDDIVATAELEISFAEWIEKERKRRAEERARRSSSPRARGETVGSKFVTL